MKPFGKNSCLLLLDLKEVEFDRRRAAEDGDHHLHRVAIEVDVLDHALEAGERTIDDADRLALVEVVLRLRLLDRLFYLVENLVGFFVGERNRLLAGTDEARDLGRVADEVPGGVWNLAAFRRLFGFELDEQVAREETRGGLNLLARLHLDHFFGGDFDAADLVFHTVSLGALNQTFGDLLLEARVRVDDEPALRHLVKPVSEAPRGPSRRGRRRRRGERRR